MNKTILLAIILFFSQKISAQTIISGTVFDQKGESVPGANIYIQDTYDGTTSDINGKFEFSTSETGSHILIIKFVGYTTFSKLIDLKGNLIEVNGEVKEEVNQLEAVTITAGSFTASDESRRTIFKAVDIASTAGATADIAGALNTLPGTQKVGESGRLFVRGGDDNEARTFVDGMLVLNAYNSTAPNTPSRGRFLPFMFKGTSFSTGGYSAEYGQALSSALVLDSKDKSEVTRTDFGILSLGADVSHTQVWERASAAGKIQYTNIRPYFNLINQRIDWIDPPTSLEGNAVFRHELGKKGLFKAFGNFSHSTFALYQHDIDDPSQKISYDLTNNYRYLNTAFRTELNDKWMVRGGASYNLIQDETLVDGRNITDLEKGIHAKTVFEGSPINQLEVKGGVEVINRDVEYDVAGPEALNSHEGFQETISAGFVEADFYASNKFVTRGGARVEHNSLLNQVSVDPRVSLAYKLGATGTLSLAYGKFRQAPVNRLLRVNHTLKSEKADHYIASFQKINNQKTFRAELYYKKYYDLVKYVNGDANQLSNHGSGYARGIELFYRDNKTFRNGDYWISYSYLDTQRDYLNFPYQATPTFASAHNFSLVYKHFITKLKSQVGATYSFTAGRPYNDPNQNKFNSSKTPNYHDLSVNVAYLPTPQIIVYVSATNLLGRNHVFGYEFSDQLNADAQYNSRPIEPAAKRFLFIGIFITLSKEKGTNQLPSL